MRTQAAFVNGQSWSRRSRRFNGNADWVDKVLRFYFDSLKLFAGELPRCLREARHYASTQRFSASLTQFEQSAPLVSRSKL